MKSQYKIINPANPRSALDDGVEDRLHVRRRAADDAEHLSRCRLMLQRLAQFRVALSEFLERLFHGVERLALTVLLDHGQLAQLHALEGGEAPAAIGAHPAT